MLTLAQWIARLTKGYAKATGKKPDKLAQLKIKFEASQKVKNQEKVIPFPQERITDWRVPRPTEGPHKADVISSGIGKKAETAKTIDEDKFVADFMAQADRAYYRFVNETLVKVQNASKDEQLQIAKDIINRKGMYHNLDEQDAAKILKSVDQNIRPVEPKASGGLAGMLGEPTYADGGRIGFKGKKFDLKRRTILKGIGALAALPIVGKFFKWAKPLAKTSKTLTSVPIGSAPGMPVWFKPLVNKVIKQGDDITKKGATQERQIVHRDVLPDGDEVIVTQHLDDGRVDVHVVNQTDGYISNTGHGGQPYNISYVKGETVIGKNKKPIKVKDKMETDEGYTYQTGPDRTDVDIDFDVVGFTEKTTKHDTSVLKSYATGKKIKSTKKMQPLEDMSPEADWDDNLPDFASGGRVPLDGGGISQLVRPGKLGYAGKDKRELFGIPWEKVKELSKRKKTYKRESPLAIPDDWLKRLKEKLSKADGGRVPLAGGKEVLKGLAWLANKIAPKSTKIGQLSKPMAPKTQVKQAIAGFQEREAAAKLKASKDRKPTDEEWELYYKDEVNPEVLTGDETIAQLDDMVAQERAYADEMYESYKRASPSERKRVISSGQPDEVPKIWENPEKVRAAVDDIFSTGDYKMDAEMAAEALVENNPAAFGGKLIDDIDDATRSEIYGAVLKVVQSDLAKTLQLKRLSKPTKTLEGIKKTGTIDISDPNVADEFTKFMKESDPKGHKKLEQTVELSNLDIKGKKGHATGGRVSLSAGGLAGMLGE